MAGIVIKLASYNRVAINLLSRILWMGDLRTEWVSTYQENGNEYHESIRLFRLGRMIKGVATLRQPNKAEEIQRFKGIYKNQILTAEYWSTRKDVIERGTFTLKRENRTQMVGFYIFFSDRPLKLRQSEYIWKKPMLT